MKEELERKEPDFHMKGLAKSVCAKDAGEMTVVLLGYVTDLQKEAYEAGRKEEREKIVEIYGKLFNDGCGCCSEKNLAEALANEEQEDNKRLNV